jgi:hypothetical protein
MICNSAAAPLASIRGTVASPRWRANTQNHHDRNRKPD